MNQVNVSLAQLASPDTESKAERIARVEQLLHDHLRKTPEVELVVLPELWAEGFFNFDHYRDLAESFGGPVMQMAGRIAKTHGSYVHLGSFVERHAASTRSDAHLTNTSVIIGRDGEPILTTYKTHIFGYKSDEPRFLTPGRALPVAATDLGKMAGVVCYDLRFPGLWQELADRGAELVAVPAAWPAKRREHWRVLSQSRAIEHQMWIFACAVVGTQRGVELCGSSQIINPLGEVLARAADDREEIITAPVDLGLSAQWRAEFPVYTDRLSNYRDFTGNTVRG